MTTPIPVDWHVTKKKSGGGLFKAWRSNRGNRSMGGEGGGAPKEAAEGDDGGGVALHEGQREGGHQHQ